MLACYVLYLIFIKNMSHIYVKNIKNQIFFGAVDGIRTRINWF